jgi:predicted XRE-type DNA-binding protein
MSRYDSVWDAIEDTPQQAGVMRLRSQLLQAIERHVHTLDVPPGVIATELHIAEARLDDILTGRIDTFSLDELAEIAVRAGLQVKLHVREAA